MIPVKTLNFEKKESLALHCRQGLMLVCSYQENIRGTERDTEGVACLIVNGTLRALVV